MGYRAATVRPSAPPAAPVAAEAEQMPQLLRQPLRIKEGFLEHSPFEAQSEQRV